MNEFIAYIVGLVTGAAVVAAYVAMYRRVADRWEKDAKRLAPHDLDQSFDHEAAHSDDYKPREFRSWL